LYVEIIIVDTLSKFFPVFDDVFDEDASWKYRNMQFEQNPEMEKLHSCLCEK
ncbi:hypothetical protein T10_9783, partial [Trichinella papuae]